MPTLNGCIKGIKFCYYYLVHTCTCIVCIHVHVHVGYISLYNDCQSENDDDSDCCSNPLRLSNVYNSTYTLCMQHTINMNNECINEYNIHVLQCYCIAQKELLYSMTLCLGFSFIVAISIHELTITI